MWLVTTCSHSFRRIGKILRHLYEKKDMSKQQSEAEEEWRHLFHLGQLSACVLIVAQVFLVSHQDDGNVGTEVFDLWGPLLRNVFCEGKRTEKEGTDQKSLARDLHFILCACLQYFYLVRLKFHYNIGGEFLLYLNFCSNGRPPPLNKGKSDSICIFSRAMCTEPSSFLLDLW